MSGQDDKGNPHHFPKVGYIPSDAERQLAETRAEEDRRQAAEDAYKQRQLTIADIQTSANIRIARYTLIAVIIAIVGNLVTFSSLWVAKQSSDAAREAAKVASDTLILMKTNGESAADQTNQLIGNTNWLARETMNAVKQARIAGETNGRNANAALNASINASRLDQRAWISVAAGRTEGGNFTGRVFTFKSATVFVRNTGKTPALEVNRECCWLVSVPVAGVIDATVDRSVPNFDTARQKHQKASYFGPTSSTTFIKGAGTVAPNTSYEEIVIDAKGITTETPAGRFEGIVMPVIADNAGHVNYIVGKITYRDVFSDVRHTTSVCLMSKLSASFVTCPTGIVMD